MGDVLVLDPPLLLGDVGLAKLPDLIRALMDQRDMSYTDLATRAGMPRSTVHLIAQGRLVHAPKLQHIEAIAHALGAPVSLLQEAVAADWGFSRPGQWQVADESDDDMRLIVATAEQLTPERKAELAAIAQTLLGLQGPDKRRTGRRKGDQPKG